MIAIALLLPEILQSIESLSIDIILRDLVLFVVVLYLKNRQIKIPYVLFVSFAMYSIFADIINHITFNVLQPRLHLRQQWLHMIAQETAKDLLKIVEHAKTYNYDSVKHSSVNNYERIETKETDA